METKKNIKRAMFIALTLLTCATASAQRRHHVHVRPCAYRPAVVRVVCRPAVTVRVCNRLNKKDRLNMALAYLNNNKTLSVSQYSKMTGLAKATAEAELDAFAVSRNNPIKLVMSGKKKLYVV